MDVYNQFAKFFIQLSFLFVNTSIIFPEMQHALRLTIIYHAVDNVRKIAHILKDMA